MKSLIIHSRRMLVLYPTIKLVVENLYTKYEFSILYMLLKTCIQNIKFQSYTFVEILLMKKYGEKEKGRRKGITNKRPILNPTLEPLIVK